MSTTNIYVLLLQGRRYYIGKSVNVMNRFQQHINGNGSAWTRKYKPVSIVKIYKNASPFDEDKITKMYMSKYGIDKVRGGSYVEVELCESQKESLQREIWSANDKCTRCGMNGHFIKNCNAKTNVNGNKIEAEDSSECDSSYDDSESDDTDASEDAYECEYCDRTFTTEFGCVVHERTCKEKINTCYRCGNPGHYASCCYAIKHAKGYII